VPEPAETKAMPKIYQVGTLRYSGRSLMVLFAWLLWGDFAFCFFENIFGRFIPLYLNDLNASNALIGVMTGSVAGVVNILFLPRISQWSDEYRSPWGRRIPFLAVVTPLTVVSMVFLGFSKEIGTWIHARAFVHLLPAVSLSVVVLTLVCLFVFAFHFFNMVLVNAFSWLQRDVVPQEFMARFLSWFRIVSTVSYVAFSWYIFPYILSHRREICTGIGLFYLVTFLLMCWKVKEGEYPPPPPRKSKPPGAIKSYVLYFRECFAVPLYRKYFIAIMMNGFAGCAAPFYLLFYRNTLGLKMDDMGEIFAVGGIVTAVSYLPVGWLCDKFSPFRVAIAAQGGMLLLAVLSFFFIRDRGTLQIFVVLTSINSVGWGLGSATMSMKLFPSAKFGQFFAATNIFGTGIAILGNFLIGLFMDLLGSNYRMAYLWAAMGGLALIPLMLVYRGWKQHGGPQNYIAPLPPQ